MTPDSSHERPIRRSQRGSGKRRLVVYALATTVALWLQLSANVLVYFWRHHHHGKEPLTPPLPQIPASVDTTPAKHPPIPERLRRASKWDRTRDPAIAGTGHNNHNANHNANLRSGSQEERDNNNNNNSINHAAASPNPKLVSSLQAQLHDLNQRLGTIQSHLEDELQESREASWNDYRQKQQQKQHAAQKPRRIFVPFTLRDAQRTVPVQIPHGFEVFDFVDLYAEQGDQNQTARHDEETENEHNDPGHLPARLYRNGQPLPERYQDDERTTDNETACRGYSKECYRSKLLRVLQYLLDLQDRHQRERSHSATPIEHYYFYLESDNDLCVPLREIRELAFRYERYLVATGTGASGWIMRSDFVRDWAAAWRAHPGWLAPESVAAHLTRDNHAWSVTRRYLTSHSILVGNTRDEASLRALFVRKPLSNNATNATEDSGPASSQGAANQTAALASSKEQKKKKETPEEAARKAPLMEPSRYLPRCLEPHRGIWKDQSSDSNKDSNSNKDAVDVHHWEFFDYEACPESDIFPCREGQLEARYKATPG